jgi:hypothetical protein
VDKLDVPKRQDESMHMMTDTLPTATAAEQTGKHEILLDMEDIHQALLERNLKYFNQAAETLFGHGILYDLVGYSGISMAAQAIVDGNFLKTYDVEDILPETRRVIAEMAMLKSLIMTRKPLFRLISIGVISLTVSKNGKKVPPHLLLEDISVIIRQ